MITINNETFAYLMRERYWLIAKIINREPLYYSWFYKNHNICTDKTK